MAQQDQQEQEETRATNEETASREVVLTYPGWELDKEQAEQLFLEYSSSTTTASRHNSNHNSNSNSSCFFRQKMTAMINKQRLYEGDRSHPELQALDATQFTYPGWQHDQEECLRRHTGDCRVWHLAGFYDLLDQMKRKQSILVADISSRDDHRWRALESHCFTYDGWQVDKAQAEQYYIVYSSNSTTTADSALVEETSDCFTLKVQGMKHKQCLHEENRSHPDIRALDALTLSYPGWEADHAAALRRHTADVKAFQLIGLHNTVPSLSQKMQKKQQVHDDRGSILALVELDAVHLTYPGWEADKATCEKYFIEYSSTNSSSSIDDPRPVNNCFRRKLVAMALKQRLYQGGDRACDPNLRALDAEQFTYDGWEHDKQQAERRLTGDCILLHIGSLGFNDTFSKMKKKQALHTNNTTEYRSSIADLRDLDALLPASSSPITTSSTAAATLPSRSELQVDTPIRIPVTPTTQPSLLQKQHPKEKSVAKAMEDNKCVVCLDNQVTHAYIPCGHLCVCGDCVANYNTSSENNHCPLCRERSYCITKIYC